MTDMETSNAVFLEIIEWFDETGREIVHRIPEAGSGDIKYGAQLVVRESQAAVFFLQRQGDGSLRSRPSHAQYRQHSDPNPAAKPSLGVYQSVCGPKCTLSI